MATRHETRYSLRNDPTRTFTIKAEVTRAERSGDRGAEITATIHRGDGPPFTYLVEFGGDFVRTKANFTPEMYLHTALSVVCSQLEAKTYRDTRLKLHRGSGLMDAEPLR